MASTLSRRLRYLRKKQGLTQVQLAERAGVRQATISEWESGKVDVMDETLLTRVCGVLGITMADLHLVKRRSKMERALQPALLPSSTPELDAFERHAHDWIQECAQEGAHDKWDDGNTDSGWVSEESEGVAGHGSSADRPSHRQTMRANRALRRDTIEHYAQQVVSEVAAVREALRRGDVPSALAHLSTAGHSHGAAYWLRQAKNDDSIRGTNGGKAGRYDVDDRTLAAAFLRWRQKGYAKKKAAEAAAADLNASMPVATIIRRLQSTGAWGKGGENP